MHGHVCAWHTPSSRWHTLSPGRDTPTGDSGFCKKLFLTSHIHGGKRGIDAVGFYSESGVRNVGGGRSPGEEGLWAKEAPRFSAAWTSIPLPGALARTGQDRQEGPLNGHCQGTLPADLLGPELVRPPDTYQPRGGAPRGLRKGPLIGLEPMTLGWCLCTCAHTRPCVHTCALPRISLRV